MYVVSIFLPIFLLLNNLNSVECLKVLKQKGNHHLFKNIFRVGNRALPDYEHEIMIAIKQNSIDKLEEMLFDVSDMQSVNYGKHKSFQEIGDLVKNEIATREVLNWLSQENDVAIVSQTNFGEYITARAKISTWERIFDAKFYEYHSTTSIASDSKTVIIRASSVSIPSHLDEHIHGIFRATGLPPPMSSGPVAQKIVETEHDDAYPDSFNVNPPTLKAQYDIFGTGNGYGSMTVYASLGQTFLPANLALFQKHFNLTNNPVQSFIGPFPNNSVCNSLSTNGDCFEASLDVQYISAVAQDVPMSYLYDNDLLTGDYLSFVLQVANLTNPTNVYSISYSSYELFQELISLQSFNIEAMKLGLRGVTLISASGDDGIAGYIQRDQPIADCGYYAQWPSASPYITSVGATQNGQAITGTPEICKCFNKYFIRFSHSFYY